MFLRCILLGIVFTVMLLLCDLLLPKLKLKYKLYKELKTKEQRRKAFEKKMKELEIK